MSNILSLKNNFSHFFIKLVFKWIDSLYHDTSAFLFVNIYSEEITIVYKEELLSDDFYIFKKIIGEATTKVYLL